MADVDGDKAISRAEFGVAAREHLHLESWSPAQRRLLVLRLGRLVACASAFAFARALGGALTPGGSRARFYFSCLRTRAAHGEFLHALRGELSARRAALVLRAFRKLDRNGDGAIGVDDVVARYDATRDPRVASGRLSAMAVLREFLEVFEVGGEVDGQVTPNEFVNYYRTVSAAIDDDDYFELLLRGAWHGRDDAAADERASGVVAARASWPCLVTRADGRQTVEEVRDTELGAAAAARGDEMDDEALLAALHAKGVDAVEVCLRGSCSAPAPPAPRPRASR